MTRKQHKRGNISKQHKSRENSREMLYNVSYKSDTMTTSGRVAGVQNIGHKRVHFYALKWYSGGASQWQRGGVMK